MSTDEQRTSRRKKKIVAVVAGAAVLAGGGVAYAYWTAGGSGTGSAATGTSTPITANQTSVITGMRPGDSAQTLSGNFTNTNGGPVYVTSVTASLGAVTKAIGAVAGTCDATDYTLATPVATVGHEVANGTGVDAWTGPTIKFNNKATNQDQCKGASIAINYTVQ